MVESNTSPHERVSTALGWEADFDGTVDPLQTLPHSFVARVQRRGETPTIFKQSGSAAFATGVRKEIIVNRDVLSGLPQPVGPALVASDGASDIPWMLFEDVSLTHQNAPTQPPTRAYIDALVRTLARVHAQARPLDLKRLFADVPGDRRITEGSEHVPAILDAFLQSIEHDRFPREAISLIEVIRDNSERVAALQESEPTLIHGDAHFGNAFFSQKKESVSGGLLIDWALAAIGPGEADLAHAIAMNLPRFVVRAEESRWFDIYACTQTELGYTTTVADVEDRYRRALLIAVVVAVGMRSVPGMRDSVWAYLFINAIEAALEHDVINLARH